MKRILSVFINRNNAVRIIVTALFTASSEPLISWSMAGLSGAFLDNELSYEALFRNVIGLTAVLLLYCHWMSFLIILIFLLPLTVNNLLMPQQVYIFDDTIRRNLDQKGTCTDEELPAIISKVKLDRFFAANGYTLDTQISNETLQVSGGEKARIGLARSLTLHKSIVISHIIHRPATRTDMMLSCGLRFKMIRKNGWNTDGYDSARGILCNFLLPKFY